MSLPRKVTVNCPKCQRAFETTIFTSINTDYAPNVPERIINGDLLTARCPYCRYVAPMEYDLLYNDMINGAMICVAHKNNKNYARNVSDIRRSPTFPGDITRLVSDMNELREKITCLELGMDDRVIELCKVFFFFDLAKKGRTLSAAGFIMA